MTKYYLLRFRVAIIRSHTAEAHATIGWHNSLKRTAAHLDKGRNYYIHDLMWLTPGNP